MENPENVDLFNSMYGTVCAGRMCGDCPLKPECRKTSTDEAFYAAFNASPETKKNTEKLLRKLKKYDEYRKLFQTSAKFV